MPYTKEGIMAQVCVAFGQGTGEIRVSQEACVALYDRYSAMITDQVLAAWEKEAVQALERIRVLGRMVAAETRLAGNSVVSAEQVMADAPKVEANSSTEICGPPPPLE
jgi:hypothetical protein